MPEIDKIMPVTNVKRDFLEIIKNMDQDDSTIAVTRNGEPVGVMMTSRRYEAIMETIEILGDREVVQSLQESAEDFKEGRVYSDDEVWE